MSYNFYWIGLSLYHIISDLGRSYKVSTLAQDYSSLLARDSIGLSRISDLFISKFPMRAAITPMIIFTVTYSTNWAMEEHFLILKELTDQSLIIGWFTVINPFNFSKNLTILTQLRSEMIISYCRIKCFALHFNIHSTRQHWLTV